MKETNKKADDKQYKFASEKIEKRRQVSFSRLPAMEIKACASSNEKRRTAREGNCQETRT